MRRGAKLAGSLVGLGLLVGGGVAMAIGSRPHDPRFPTVQMSEQVYGMMAIDPLHGRAFIITENGGPSMLSRLIRGPGAVSLQSRPVPPMRSPSRLIPVQGTSSP